SVRRQIAMARRLPAVALLTLLLLRRRRGDGLAGVLNLRINDRLHLTRFARRHLPVRRRRLAAKQRQDFHQATPRRMARPLRGGIGEATIADSAPLWRSRAALRAVILQAFNGRAAAAV